MRTRSVARSLSLAALAVGILAAPAYAFLDDIAKMKEELQTYQTTHAANFGDFVAKLDEIAGPIFNDVKEGDWFYKYVASVADWGIVNGYVDKSGQRTGVYGPKNNVTVAEALKIAFKAAQVDETQCKKMTFDVQARTHWAMPFVACAEQIGVRLFSGEHEPDLNRPVTRAEVLSILDDAFAEQVPPLYSNFQDTRGNKFEADIAYAVSRGVVSGDMDAQGNSLGIFRPDDKINRAEMAKIVYQQLKARVTLQTQGQQS